MIISFALEMISLLVICDVISGTPLNIIMNYLGLGVIAEIDSIYLEVNKTEQYMNFGNDESFPPYKVFDKKNKNLRNRDRNFCNSVLYLIYRLVKIIFSSGYYYFFPLVIQLLTYKVEGNIKCADLELDDENFCFLKYHSFKFPDHAFTHV